MVEENSNLKLLSQHQVSRQAPRESEVERTLYSWLSQLSGKAADEGSLLDALDTVEIKALALYTSRPDFFSDLLLGLRKQPSLLRRKLFYNLTPIQSSFVQDIMKAGAACYIGYRNRFLIPSVDNEWLRETLLNGIKALIGGGTCGEIYRKSIQAYDDAERNFISDSSPIDIRNAIALQENRKSLFCLGDKKWQIPFGSDVILLTTAIGDHIPRQIEVIDITPDVIRWLDEDPRRMSQLSPERFEDLIANRLRAQQLSVLKISNTFRRDGGIDIVAWPTDTNVEFPFLIAVQTKLRKKLGNVGSPTVREFRGAIADQPVDVGVIITNAKFTPDAQWVAANSSKIIRLRDFDDLRRWLAGKFTGKEVLREIPEQLKLAQGLEISIPRIMRAE